MWKSNLPKPMDAVVLAHIPKLLVVLPVPMCVIKLLKWRGWCGRVFVCSDNDSSFLTACGDAAPNFGGRRSCGSKICACVRERRWRGIKNIEYNSFLKRNQKKKQRKNVGKKSFLPLFVMIATPPAI